MKTKLPKGLKIKKTLLIGLIPFLLYGKIYTELQCQSISGKTELTVINPSFSEKFQNARLMINKKSLNYKEKNANNRVVNRLTDGVFTLSYEDSVKKLTLYALPKSIKKIKSKIINANYIFDAIISNESTDPRKTNSTISDTSLDYDIKVECTFEIR
jgi:hypothetical protein